MVMNFNNSIIHNRLKTKETIHGTIAFGRRKVKQGNFMGKTELVFASTMDKNHALKTLKQMNKVTDWFRIEKNLKKYSKIEFISEGTEAYHPLMFFKCLLLQK